MKVLTVRNGVILVVVLAAAAAAFYAMRPEPAHAADLGGDCCADLEQRVATLEANTPRKGTNRVSLTISGVVDESILSGSDSFGTGSHTYILANPNDGPEIDINADAKLTKDWHVGSTLEILIDQQTPGTTGTGTLSTRQTYVYVKNDMVAVKLGAVNEASKGLEEDGVVDLTAVAPMLDISSLVAWGGVTFPGELFGGTTEDGIKVEITPLKGLTLAGSYGNEVVNGDAIKDFAARYSAEPVKNIIVNAGVGYHIDDMTGDKVLKANLGVEEAISGIFAQMGYGRDQLLGVSGWEVQGGLDKALLPFGKTDVYAEYGALTGVPGTSGPKLYGVGIQQNFDAADALVYAGYRHYDSTDAKSDTVDLLQAGLKVKF